MIAFNCPKSPDEVAMARMDIEHRWSPNLKVAVKPGTIAMTFFVCQTCRKTLQYDGEPGTQVRCQSCGMCLTVPWPLRSADSSAGPVSQTPALVSANIYSLELLTGPIPERRIVLDRPRITLGRDPNCTVFIMLPDVDLVHANIRRGKDDCWIEDGDDRGRRSIRGTHVNNHPIDGLTPLKDGDRIKICDCVCEFHCNAPPPAGAYGNPPSQGGQPTTVAQTNPAKAGILKKLSDDPLASVLRCPRCGQDDRVMLGKDGYFCNRCVGFFRALEPMPLTSVTASDGKAARVVHRMKAGAAPRIALAGMTSSGKSTLVNALFGRPIAEVRRTPDTTKFVFRVDFPSGLVVYDTPGVNGNKLFENYTRAFLGLKQDPELETAEQIPFQVSGDPRITYLNPKNWNPSGHLMFFDTVLWLVDIHRTLTRQDKRALRAFFLELQEKFKLRFCKLHMLCRE